MNETDSAVAVIGGGTMGAGIALVFAAGGWRVHVVEPSAPVRERLAERLGAEDARMRAPGEVLDRCRAHPALEAVPWDGVSLVVECVPEVLELKRDLFRRLEALAPPGAALTSNTSSFPVAEIASRLEDPSRLAVLHFFMPAHLVPLVEVVRGEATAPGLPERLGDIVRALGKVPVQVRRDVPGFVANRLQHALMREALALVEAGVVSAEDVDAATRFGFGFRYLAAGPLLQKDLSGLDIHHQAARTIYPDLCNAAEPGRILRERIAAGETGMKSPSRRGFFTWTGDSAARERARYEALLAAALDLLRDEIAASQHP